MTNKDTALMKQIEKNPTDFLGWLPEQDVLSLNYPAMAVIENAEVFTKTWRTPKATEQVGPRCVGWGTHRVVNTQPWTGLISYARRNRLDEMAIYDWAQRHDRWPGHHYPGTSGNAGMKALLKNGVISEYRHCRTMQEILVWLSNKGPVGVGSTWFNSMFDQFDVDPGYVPYRMVVDPSSGVAGGHFYALHGVDTRTQTVIGTNSWGTEWGDDGRFYLSWEDLDFLMQQGGEAHVISAA